MNFAVNMATSALMKAKNVTTGMIVETTLMKKDVISRHATRVNFGAPMPYASLFAGDAMDIRTVQTSQMSGIAHLSPAWIQNFSVHQRKNVLTSQNFAMENKIVMTALMKRRIAHPASAGRCLANMAAVHPWKAATASALQA